MSSAFYWLTNLIDCKAVAQYFTPTPPANAEELLRKMMKTLDDLEERQARLVRELRMFQSERQRLKEKGVPATVVEQQMLQHIQAIKEIETENKRIVAQYNEVARANSRRQMLATSVETTRVLQAVSNEMKAQLKSVGGSDTIQDTIETIGDTMDEAEKLTAFTSRAIIPDGMDVFRETGVLPAPLSLDEQLADYLYSSGAASSVQEPARPTASPYVEIAHTPATPLGVHEPA